MNKSDSKRVTLWTVVNLIIFFATLGVNYLGASGFFNGLGQAAVSSKYQTLLTPNGFAFSIWGVIYTLVFATLVYLFIKKKDPAVSKLIGLVSAPFVVSSLFNMAWIVAFSYEKIGLSNLFIIGILISLMTIVHRIYSARSEIPVTLAGTAFSLYASWVFVATILNTAILSVQQGWQGFGISSSVWTITVLVIIVAVVLGYVLRYKNAIFPIAIAWAYFGIYSAYTNGLVAPLMAPIIQVVLLFGIAVFIALSVYMYFNNNYAIFPPNKA